MVGRLKTLFPVSFRKAVKRHLGLTRKDLLRQMPVSAVCLEIGVDKGNFSQRILDITRPEKLHLIDPWEVFTGPEFASSRYGAQDTDIRTKQAAMDQLFASVQQRFAAPIAAGQVVLHRGYSQDLAASFPDEYFDWIYIDGNHVYDYVKRDLELYFDKVKPGGWIVGDDYGVSGWWEDGVTRAVDEFAAKHSLKRRKLREQFVLRKPPKA